MMADVANKTQMDKHMSGSSEIYFWGGASPFSQHHPCCINFHGLLFNSAEQFVMYYKALKFGDFSTADKIMKDANPFSLSRLDGVISGFDIEQWHSARKDLMWIANYQKFTQNPHLNQALMNTHDRKLVDRHPSELFSREDNLLGEMLIALRDYLRSQGHLLSRSLPASSQKSGNDEILYFWGGASPFSQHHLSCIKFHDLLFNSAEQFVMYHKALMYGDSSTAFKIMKETNPSFQHRLGRSVNGLDHRRWHLERNFVVWQANHEKFTQNPHLYQALMLTGDVKLVEQPRPSLHSRSRATEYIQDNLLGETLVALRDCLRRGNYPSWGSLPVSSQRLHAEPFVMKSVDPTAEASDETDFSKTSAMQPDDPSTSAAYIFNSSCNAMMDVLESAGTAETTSSEPVMCRTEDRSTYTADIEAGANVQAVHLSETEYREDPLNQECSTASNQVQKTAIVLKTEDTKMREFIPIKRVHRTNQNPENEPPLQFFWSKASSFHQHYKCHFDFDEKCYSSSGQFVLCYKALLFDDLARAEQINQEKDYRNQEKLGRGVKGYNEERWKTFEADVIWTANYEKFTQSQHLYDELISTRGHALLAGHETAYQRKAWRGDNLLGEILTDLREHLIAQNITLRCQGMTICNQRNKKYPSSPLKNNVAVEPNYELKRYQRVQRKVKIPQREAFVYFWGKDNPFSQHHMCHFEFNGQHYNCAEQFMMQHKALFFKDEFTADKVMKTSSPVYQKKLGRTVQGFEFDKWMTISEDIVWTGNYLKFSQNRHLYDQLMATQGCTLVEASPHDKLWGIGLGEEDSRAHQRETWEGQNLLGEILTDLRENFVNKPIHFKALTPNPGSRQHPRDWEHPAHYDNRAIYANSRQALTSNPGSRQHPWDWEHPAHYDNRATYANNRSSSRGKSKYKPGNIKRSRKDP